MSFQQLGLNAELLRAVSKQGYETPTPIQKQAIPAILKQQDVLAAAQTGTGKTAGFTLPLLQLLEAQSLSGKRTPVIKALILTPTRELAAQVYESVTEYGEFLPLRAMTIFGGVSSAPQIKQLRKGVDILIATPGRLLDLINQNHIKLSSVELFVLDEADRMLDMGFIRDIKKIIKLLPRKRQNLLFSATFSKEVKKIAAELLNNPIEISIDHQNRAASTVTHSLYPVERDRKRELLSYLIGSRNWQQVLVFVRTKHGAERLGKQLLRDGIRTATLHGNKSQNARNKALDFFKNGSITALVATDIAARGLDIEQLPQVVNFDLPSVAEDYVHRIGRTGRAGLTGSAISLVCQDDIKLLIAVERLLDHKIIEVNEPGYETKLSRKAKSSPTKTPAKKKPANNKTAKKNSEKPKHNPWGKRAGLDKPSHSKSRRPKNSSKSGKNHHS